jgi:dehydrogenase/reductase SDR family member 1
MHLLYCYLAYILAAQSWKGPWHAGANAFAFRTSAALATRRGSVLSNVPHTKHFGNLVSGNEVERSLSGMVCLVTGASRGIGKGIALELGNAGATVYITGTTALDLQATADEISRTGVGIPIICNHEKDKDVRSLVATIEKRHGKLDLLVNNAFRLPDSGVAQLQRPFWEQPAAVAWDPIHTVGLRSHYQATVEAMPLLRKSTTRPLIVMISSFGGLTYSFNVAYGVGKAGVDRMVKDMSIEFANHDLDITVVSLWPGVVNTERTAQSVDNGDWEKYVGLPLDMAESPRFTGKAVVALFNDTNNKEKTGSYQVVAELANEYDFVDVNGMRPPSIRSLKFLLPAYGMSESLREQVPSKWIPDWKLPFWLMAQGKPPEKAKR